MLGSDKLDKRSTLMITIKDLVNHTYNKNVLNIFDFTLNMSSSGATDGAFMQLDFSTEKKKKTFDKTLKYVQKNPSFSCKNGLRKANRRS